MDNRNFILSALAVFVVHPSLDLAIHGELLTGTYEPSADMWRSQDDMGRMIPVMILVGLLWSVLFTYFFSRVAKGEGVMEGVRYGFCMGLFVTVPMSLGTYALMPIPGSLALGWFVRGMIQLVICGVVLSLVYRPAAVDRT